MKIDLQVKNNRLPQLASEIENNLSAAIRKCASDIEAGAKQRAPVDTGALRNSYQTEMQGKLAAIVFSNLNYAKFIELGTVNMRARPHLIPAYEAARVPFESALRTLIK